MGVCDGSVHREQQTLAEVRTVVAVVLIEEETGGGGQNCPGVKSWVQRRGGGWVLISQVERRWRKERWGVATGPVIQTLWGPLPFFLGGMRYNIVKVETHTRLLYIQYIWR